MERNLCLLTGKYNIVIMFIFSKTTYRFDPLHIKIPMAYFTEIEKKNPKIHMAQQKTLTGQSNIEKGEQSFMHHTS